MISVRWGGGGGEHSTKIYCFNFFIEKYFLKTHAILLYSLVSLLLNNILKYSTINYPVKVNWERERREKNPFWFVYAKRVRKCKKKKTLNKHFYRN